MNEIEPIPQSPHPVQQPYPVQRLHSVEPPVAETKPAPAEQPPRYPLLDGVVLFVLLALCAGVYRVVGDAGFSVITAAVAGLYGTWRLRR
ncbi:hypothetical protein ACFWA1_30475 [Streptomyces sp. NPDC060005]|uniref:hypothetical protein n=1 Tax=Streptomyces sp. NPDC060005 TaxID=3347034 RepID=UPI00367BFD80